jgi:anti-anti-sigma factor
MYLTIAQRIEDGVAVIALTGRLLLGPEGAEMERLVSELIASGVRKFVFDFTHLTHIDSTGIGRCIASLNLIMQAGGALAIGGAAGQVRDGFRVTQLDRVFRFCPDVAAATAAVAAVA